MRGPLLLVALLSLGSATAAHAAAPNAPGVNLRWDQCYADGGAWNRNFACDTNTGTSRMVGSFELASDPASPVSGLDVYMNIASVGTLPTWWHFRNIATCRQLSMFANGTLPVGAVNCVDWSGGSGIGSVNSYEVGSVASSGPNTAYLQAAFAVSPENLAELYAGQEYFAFNIGFNHAKTVGTGACAGCQTPVVVFLSAIRLRTAIVANDLLMTRGANWLGSQYVSWQHGYPTNIRHGFVSTFGGPKPNVLFDTVPYDVTHARPSTWSAVKSLYR